MTNQQTNPWLALDGRIALVTGAASGIGRAAAIALAAAGATTLLLDRDEAGAQATAAVIAKTQGQAFARGLDVTSESQWNDTVSWIEKQWGRLDILVNCAGVMFSDRVGDASLDTYRKTFAINVEGSLLGMAAALHFMRAAGKGSIINLSSTAALKGNPSMASYGASKAAVAHFTRSAALETARSFDGIRINAIHPGLIETSMADDFYKALEKIGPPAAVVAMTTSGRPGKPEDVADLILFLASDRASFISGASINIDRAASA